jgi:hypothetical protein
MASDFQVDFVIFYHITNFMSLKWKGSLNSDGQQFFQLSEYDNPQNIFKVQFDMTK